MKNFLFAPLTDFRRLVKCLLLPFGLWVGSPPKEDHKRTRPPTLDSQHECGSFGSTAQTIHVQLESAVVPASLLTPAPPDTTPKVRLQAEALASLACAEPGELVLIATIPPGTVLTTALLETLDMKVVHRDQLADLIGWGFVRVEKAH